MGQYSLDSPTSRYFSEFLSKSVHDPKNFGGGCVELSLRVEEMIECSIFIYDFDVQEGDHLGELARLSIGRFDKTVKLLRLNNHIIDTNDIHSCFDVLRVFDVLPETVSSIDRTISANIL